MRNDMAEVIIERPRDRKHNAGKGVRRLEQQLARCDGLPTKAPMTARYVKESLSDFNDLLGPLCRFLVTQARRSRRWDDVYSELRERWSRNGKIQPHMVRHALEFVATEVVIVNGRPQPANADRSNFHRHELVWVHPDTGILMVVEDQPEEPKFKYHVSPKQLYINEFNRYVLLDGVWKRVLLRPLPTLIFGKLWEPITCDPGQVHDALLGLMRIGYYDDGRWKLERVWQGSYFASALRGLGSKETRRVNQLLGYEAPRRSERSACIVRKS